MADAPTLPVFYARWMEDLLDGAAVPSESRATCDDCVMCEKPDGRKPASAYAFDPQTKCCTYMPQLPNFLVGSLLGDSDPVVARGRAVVRERLSAGVGVQPLGLERPAAYDLLFRHSVNAVGRCRTLQCPYYLEDEGSCGIWKWRDHMCTTWFCKHERGAVGKRFWVRLKELLAFVERELSRWAALEQGIDPETVQALSQILDDGRPDGPAIDGRLDEEAHREAWGDWAGREEAFYRACAEAVDGLRWEDVETIGGTELQILAGQVQEAHGALQRTDLPESLQLGSFQVAGPGPRTGVLRVYAYSPLDPLDLPEPLVRLLPAFDGRSLNELRTAAAERGLVWDDDRLIRTLVDWGVLRAGTTDSSGEPSAL